MKTTNTIHSALVVGTQSGCGKTTIMLALLRYFQQQSCTVQSFKAGPDYLDPFWHEKITARPSYNLDTKMMGEEACRQQFHQHIDNTDIALIEGVMGLFDGATGVGELGSSAHLAKVLNVPVILVVNVKGMAGSIVPLVKGFSDYAHTLGITLSGIIANHAGSDHHVKLLENLLTTHQLPPLIAWMKKDAPSLPERHLGLVQPDNMPAPDFSSHFQVNKTALYSALALKKSESIVLIPSPPLLKNKVIAVTKDEACCFMYPANIEWLQSMGATVVFFSLLNGESIPEKADALWITGGYPELYAETLAKKADWNSLKVFIDADKPVLAECGGAMLLGENLIDLDEKSYEMAGVLPFSSVMKKRLVSLGYRQDESGICGHEFHHSARINDDNLLPCFTLNRGDRGIRYKNLRASYIHWYFASAPSIAAKWFL